MSDQNTTWYIRLMDLVTGPLKKITEHATGTNKRISDLTNTTKQFTQHTNVLGREFKRNISQLNTTLDGLKKRQAEAYSTKHIQAYQRMIDKTTAELKRMNDVVKPPAKGWSKWTGDLKSALSEIPGVGQALALLKNPLALVGSAAIAIGVASTNIAMNFETGVAKINATAQLAHNELKKLDGRLVEIGEHSGGNFDRIPETYEKILSVTGKVNQSLELTELAVKGAKAGFTDLDIVGNALARTMNVISDKTVSAKNMLDMLMMAKNVGAGEFKDFAQYIPGLISSAQPSGYNHKDAIGIFSTLSKSFEGSEASTYTQNLFTAFKKTDIIYQLEKAGIKVFKNGFRRPINEVLMDLAQLQKKMNPEQFTNFMDAIKLRDVQAATAIGTLTGNVDALREVFDGLNRSIGETDRALAFTENTARTWADIGDELKGIGKAIGDFLLPMVDVLVQGIAKAGRGLKNLFNGSMIADLFKNSTWRDETDEEIKMAARREAATRIAEQRTREHYKLNVGQPFNREQFAFYRSIFEQNTAPQSDSRNQIVSEHREAKGVAGKKLHDATKGIDMANAAMNENRDGGGGNGGSGSSSGGNKGPSQLIMYLTVNNKFVEGKDSEGDIKRNITKLITDAVRDGLVAAGT